MGCMVLKLRHFYEFGPFRLEPDERLLRNGDQALALAPKYFDLLVLLVQNSGRLLTKDQIMQTVWSGSIVEEANLTVAISAIRKTLAEKESGIPYIETVPKKGYRFTAKVKEVEEDPTPSFPKFDATVSEVREVSSRSGVEDHRSGSAVFSSGKDPSPMPIMAPPAIPLLPGDSAMPPASTEPLAAVSRHVS